MYSISCICWKHLAIPTTRTSIECFPTVLIYSERISLYLINVFFYFTIGVLFSDSFPMSVPLAWSPYMSCGSEFNHIIKWGENFNFGNCVVDTRNTRIALTVDSRLIARLLWLQLCYTCEPKQIYRFFAQIYHSNKAIFRREMKKIDRNIYRITELLPKNQI